MEFHEELRTLSALHSQAMIRLSLGDETAKEDADYLIERVKELTKQRNEQSRKNLQKQNIAYRFQ